MSSTGISFANYDTAAKSTVDQNGTVTAICNGNGGSNPVVLTLFGGNSGTCSRQMISGSYTVNYGVYSDSAYSSTLCSPNIVSDDFDLRGSGSVTHTYDLYGRVPSGLVVAPNTYGDTLTARLTYSGSSWSTSVPISQTAVKSCSVTGGSLNFGTKTVAIATATAAVTPTCSLSTPYYISLGAGQNASGGTRRMAGPLGSYIAYDLYSDSAMTTLWGDGTSYGAVFNRAGTGYADPATVYGRVSVGGMPRAGSYSDTVTVVVTY